MEHTEWLALVAKASEGDAEAFGAICQHKAKDVLYICTQLMGCLPDGEDAAQEVFLAMQTSILRLREPKAFPAWSNRIIANTCKRMLRTGRRFTSVPIDVFTQEFEEMHPEFLPQDFAESQEKKQIVLDAMHSLSFRYRAALVLFYYENLPMKDIAEALDTNVKGVENLLHRARKALRREVEKRSQAAREGAVVSMGGVLALTRVLQADAARLPLESVGRVAAIGTVGAGGAVAGSTLAAGTGTGAMAAVPAVTAAALSVAAAAALTIGAFSAAPAPEMASLATAPPAVAAQAMEGPGGADEADIQEENPLFFSSDGSVPPGGSASAAGAAAVPPGEQGPTARQEEAASGARAQSYTGQLCFVTQEGARLTEHNALAQGFVVQVYDDQRYIASAVVDAQGGYAFTLTGPPERFTLRVDALHGYGPAGANGFTLSAAGEVSRLPDIYFTDTLAPSAAIHFLDGGGNHQEGEVNPAGARITLYDATPVEVNWRVENAAGETVLSGGGNEVAMALPGPGEYTLVCTLRDTAGNTGSAQRAFTLLEGGQV